MTVPTPVNNFMGRDEVMDSLIHLFGDRKYNPIVIVGIGGVGKTSLVATFLNVYFNSDAVVWAGFYESPNPADLLVDIIHKLQSPNAKPPSIVVLDGAERISDAVLAEATARISQIEPNTKIIITSRSSVDLKNAAYLRLDGLSYLGAVGLIDRLTDSSLLPEQRTALADRLNNHPLAITLTAPLIKKMGFEAVMRSLNEEIYRFSPASVAETEKLVKLVRPQILTVNEFLIEKLKRSPQDIYQIPPRMFEQLVAELLSDMGWDVELTQSTRDGGKDILAYTKTDIGRFLCLVEAKRFSKDRPVGVSIVRSLYGTFCDYQANSCLLVTTSTFTRDARIFQRRHEYQIGLKDYLDVVDWIKRYRLKDS